MADMVVVVSKLMHIGCIRRCQRFLLLLPMLFICRRFLFLATLSFVGAARTFFFVYAAAAWRPCISAADAADSQFVLLILMPDRVDELHLGGNQKRQVLLLAMAQCPLAGLALSLSTHGSMALCV